MKQQSKLYRRLPPLHVQIAVSMAAGAACGIFLGPNASVSGILLTSVYGFLGTAFINALKMIIVPLILSSIITGVTGMKSGEELGRLGAFTVVYYMVTSLMAILAGLFLVQLIEPGLTGGLPVGNSLGLGALPQDVVEKISNHGSADLAHVFLRMIPANIFRAAAEGQMLGIIFFGIISGLALLKLQGELSIQTVIHFWDGLFRVMMLITEWIMKFAPIGIFGLVAGVTASTGLSALSSLACFFITVVAALAIHSLVTLPALLVSAGINPLKHVRNVLPALVTAFSTASSSATLPVTMECLEKNARVPNRITSFVLPLGATVNMDGTALYECVAAMFLAQAYGLKLSFAQQFTVVLTALLTSVGVAGIPAASLVAITVILGTIGLPAEAIAPLLVVDRILDMCRTNVNVFSDSCGASIIHRFEKQISTGPKNSHAESSSGP